MRLFTLASIAALAFAGAASAQMAPSGGSTAALPTPDYLKTAAQSDEFEVKEGHMAAMMGKSAKIRAAGREMVKDHTKSTKELMAAAHSEGMHPSKPPMSDDQKQMVASLAATSGADFDKMYVQQQLQAHQEALQVHTAYANGGSDPALKSTAGEIVPVVQKHLDMFQSMSAM